MFAELVLQRCVGGTVKLPYSERNMMYALKRQALKGPYAPEKMPELGWFDWVGHDIRCALHLPVNILIAN